MLPFLTNEESNPTEQDSRGFVQGNIRLVTARHITCHWLAHAPVTKRRGEVPFASVMWTVRVFVRTEEPRTNVPCLLGLSMCRAVSSLSTWTCSLTRQPTPLHELPWSYQFIRLHERAVKHRDARAGENRIHSKPLPSIWGPLAFTHKAVAPPPSLVQWLSLSQWALHDASS